MDADEMIFIHKGKYTMMGNIPFEYGDYLIIPGELSIKLILIQQLIDCCMSNHSRQFIPKRQK
jgi:homogentisate 1,2-dioxygenase